MKKLLIIVLVIALLGGGLYIFLIKNGHTTESILNTPNKMGLSVDCTDLDNFLVTSSIDITVKNNSSKTYEKVVIHLTAYDQNGNVLKQKDVKVRGKLKPNNELYKTTSLPAKTESCDCVVLSSESV